MMNWSPGCFIPSFVKIAPPVPEKNILKGFYHISARWPSLLCEQHQHQIFIALYLKGFIQKLVQIGTVVSEKIQFEFLYVHDLGPRSRNDIDLQYSTTTLYIKN